MPELPEMHAYRKRIAEAFEGRSLTGVTLASKRTNVPGLVEAINGRRLDAVRRVGKELTLDFDGGHALGIHLMISGKLVIGDAGDEPPNVCASLAFGGGRALHLCDRQRLARFILDPPEPDAPDAISESVDADYLRERFAASPRTTVKSYLMDQNALMGIGNAYSDEILWRSRIAPQSKVGKLPGEKVEQLAVTIHEVLGEAIALIDGLDDPSQYREKRRLDVHVKDRDRTPTGAEIKTATVGGRKAFFTEEQTLYA